MKEKLLAHVEKKGSLVEKLDFLTRLYLWSGNHVVCDACEAVRYELTKTKETQWISYPNGRKGGSSMFVLYRNGQFWGEVALKSEVKKIMFHYK